MRLLRPRRALLYTPGDDLRKIEKSARLDVDCVCLDIEDGVAANRKEEARQCIPQALRTLDFGRSERLVRVRSLATGQTASDLAAALSVRPDGIVLPKVDSAEAVRQVSAQIAAAEAANGWQAGGIRLLVLIETALAFVRLAEICQADDRLDGLIFGAEDFTADLGAVRTPEGTELLYARSALVMHAVAFGLQPIDFVQTDFTHPEVVATEARQGAGMGFQGKQVIHPAQVEPVQQAFTPSDAAIAHAMALLAADEEHQRSGKGAFTFEGRMVDAPVIKAAQNTLARARAAGKINN